MARPAQRILMQQPAAAVPRAGLVALVYVSTSRHLLTQTEVLYLLERARRRNAQHGVTGVLLYADGNFMQYLEGPLAGVERVYDIIRADPLHHGLIELLREPLHRREFGEWRMGFRSARGTTAQLEPDGQLDRRLEDDHAASPGRCMLHTFWNRARWPGNG